jgi:hypothetical protein
VAVDLTIRSDEESLHEDHVNASQILQDKRKQ